MSKEEGIAKDQWCYLPNEKGAYAEGMKVKANVLGLSGYRLPTDAEWEYACRAGSVTIWPHGDAEELLDKYAWNDTNKSSHSRPGGLLRPNDWGFYDLHGNLWEWCQNRFEDFPDKKDPEKEDIVDNKNGRPVRGALYYQGPSMVRPATRYEEMPTLGNDSNGFRPARTYP